MGLTEYVQTIVVGGGQAGLSAGYFLKRAGLPFTILDANLRVGDAWRQRWDSLRLFTPARYSGLAGMPFPAPPQSFPTKDQMADYLELYAAKFELPVRNGVKVESLVREGGRYVLTCGERRFEADHVVVAMASYQKTKTPRFAAELDPNIVQFHSKDYKNPKQLKKGGVLIVGAGNSGAEIAMDVSRAHHTWLSGRDVGQVPFRICGLAGRLFLQKLIFRVVFHRILTNNTPMGRKARAEILSKGGPLIRTRSQDLKAAGVARVPRVAGVRGGLPLLEDGRVIEVENVIWSTGFSSGSSWIRVPVFDSTGRPKHEDGVVAKQPGMYFVGLPFIHAFSSTMIHGVGRDAERIAEVIQDRVRHSSKVGVPSEETPAASVPIAG